MACVTKLLCETRVYSLFLFFKYAVSLFRTADEIFVVAVTWLKMVSVLRRSSFGGKNFVDERYLGEPRGGRRPFDTLKCSWMRYYDNRFNLLRHQMRYVGYELVNLVVETEIRLTRAGICVSFYEIDS